MAEPQSLAQIAADVMQGNNAEEYAPLPMHEDEYANPEILSDSTETEEPTTEQPAEGESEAPIAPAVQPQGATPIRVTDESGKSYDVKVDISKPEQVQKLAQFAVEASQLRKEVVSLRETAAKAASYESEFNEIRSLMTEKGLPGVVDYLMDKDNAFEEFIENERQRRNLLDSSHPEERDAALKEYELEKRERLLNAREKGLTEKQVQSQAQAEQAAADRVQSFFTNAWSKHSFEGKLGDPEVEDMFNQGVFNVVNAEVDAAVKAGQKLSQAEMNNIVEKHFAKARKGLGNAVDKQAKQETQAAKVTASKAIEARTSPAPARGGSPQSEAVKSYKEGKGSIADMVKAFLNR